MDFNGTALILVQNTSKVWMAKCLFTVSVRISGRVLTTTVDCDRRHLVSTFLFIVCIYTFQFVYIYFAVCIYTRGTKVYN